MMLRPYSEDIFIMTDGDESSKEQFHSAESAIAWAKIKGKSAWRVKTFIADNGMLINKHERYSFGHQKWEAR